MRTEQALRILERSELLIPHFRNFIRDAPATTINELLRVIKHAQTRRNMRWVTRVGKRILLSDMDDGHVYNSYRMVKRRNEKHGFSIKKEDMPLYQECLFRGFDPDVDQSAFEERNRKWLEENG